MPVRAPLSALFAAALSLTPEPPGGRAPADQWDDSVIGAAACGSCHQDQYRDWLATPHARAWSVLGPAEREDPRCVGCHTTSDRPGARGVQCESCHGPGADYWPDFVMRDRPLAGALGLKKGDSAAVCARCHTPDTPAILPFDIRRALPRVRHQPSVSRWDSP